VGVAGYSVFGLCTACLGPGLLQLLAIGGYLVVILLPIWPFIYWMTAGPGWIKKVETDGKQATATILSVKDTGMVINNTVAVIKLQLRVEPSNEAPFEVSLEKHISMITGLGGYAASAQVKVKYDPDNKSHVVIVSEPDTPTDDRVRPSGVDVTQQLAELSKLHKSGELNDSEFAAAKKKLLE
jgi:Short C-terminal domain